MAVKQYKRPSDKINIYCVFCPRHTPKRQFFPTEDLAQAEHDHLTADGKLASIETVRFALSKAGICETLNLWTERVLHVEQETKAKA